MSATAGFTRLFESRRRALERSRVARASLTGLCLGLTFGAGVSGLLLVLGAAEWRLFGVGVAALGAILGASSGVRNRLTAEDAAMFFDARLKSKSEISTALAPVNVLSRDTGLLELVQHRAEVMLRAAAPAVLRPRVFSRFHLGGFASAAALFWMCWLAPSTPTQSAQAQTPLPLSARGRVDVDAFERLEQLPEMDSKRASRLAELATLANQLNADMADGTPRRDLLSKIAKMRDVLAAELGEFGNAENRSGLAAAVNALRNEPLTEAASRALAAADLVRFDEEMKRLAGTAEEKSRKAARAALERAELAAKNERSNAVTLELSEQLRRMTARSQDGDLLQKLAATLDSDIEEAPPSGSSNAQPDTLKPLSEGLKTLDGTAKRKLAARLEKGIESGEFDFRPGAGDELERLANQIADPAARSELIRRLKAIGEPSYGAQRQQAIKDALHSLGQTQRELGRPANRTQTGSSEGTPGAPNRSQSTASGTPTPGRGGQLGSHPGRTENVETETLYSRSKPVFNFGQPLLESSQGRAPGRTAHTARESSKPPGFASAPEVQGIERTPIPAEYREQVSRYFSPE